MRLRRATLQTGIALALCGCATNMSSGSPDEVIVQGRLENLGYEPLDVPDDLIGHGIITANLHISRVLRGRVAAPVITVRYIEHGYLQSGPTFRYRLKKTRDGSYLICASGGTGFRCP